MIPTRKRVKSLDRVLHSIWDMSSSEDAVEILLRCDEDDQETIDYLAGIMEHKLQVLVGLREDGYKSVPSFVNDMEAKAKGNLLMVINDDVIFRTKNWDKTVEEVAGRYKDGIFNIGVNAILNPQLFVFPIVSRRWVDIVGYFFDPRLFWHDVCLKDVSDALGRSIYLPEVIVEHMWAGFNPDTTRNEGAKWTQDIVLIDPSTPLHIAEASPDGWRDEYRRLHNKVVAEVIEKLKPHLDSKGKSD